MKRLVPVLIAGVVGGPLAAQTLPVFDPAQPFQVTGLADGAALVTSGGTPFLCTLDTAEGAARLGTCTPIVTEDAAAAATAARDSDAAALAAATARADSATARAETAEAAADAAKAEIAALTDEIATLRDRLAPFLAADAAAAEASALLDRVIALEQAAVAFGLMTEEEVVGAALGALGRVMAEQGDACTLSLATVEKNGGESWLQRAVYGGMMDDLDIAEDTRTLLLSYMLDRPDDETSAHKAFAAEVETTTDDEVYKKANYAVGLARRNLGDMEKTVDAAMRDPAHITLAEDRLSVTLVDCS